jgi:hypothetical protein
MATAGLDGINTLTLTHARGNQLKYWIVQVNWIVSEHVLSKTGRVDELRRRLAMYDGLDLSTLPRAIVKASPLALDEDIQQQQWGYLQDLGNEWAEMTAAGQQFRLCGALAGMFIL